MLDRLREKSFFFFFRRFAKERQKECQALLLAEPAASTAWNREREKISATSLLGEVSLASADDRSHC